jgi:4-hydroxybenzoate polyprenyltransferase
VSQGPFVPAQPDEAPAAGSAIAASSSHSSAAFSPAALLWVMRPKQWTKNLALFAPLIFALRLTHGTEVLHATLGVISFCLLAGSVYIFNDLADREKDRLHPEKRKRPIASGALPPAAAIVWGVCTITAGLFLANYVSRGLLYVDVTYLGMQLAYTMGLKQLAILDVMMIAVGFVLRVVAGAEAIDVPVSNWLYLCTLCLALFLGFCKRRHELLLLEGDATAHRANLADYSPALLDQVIGITTAMTLVSYALYTMSSDTIAKFGTDNLKLTIPFVFYGVFRYLYLVYKKSQGGSPERILLSDNPMRWTVALYALVVVAVLYQRIL